MRKNLFIALLLCGGMADETRAGVVLLDFWRGVDIEGSLVTHDLIDDAEVWTTEGDREVSVVGETTWLDWYARVASSQTSGISTDGFWGIGNAQVYSGGTRYDSNRFDALASNAIVVNFTVDVPTPYELYFSAVVSDSVSEPDLTDAYMLLGGPDGLVAGRFVPDGEAEYESQGTLAPGRYHFDVHALASLWANHDDGGFADYAFYLTLPEPSSLVLLVVALAVPSTLRRARERR